MPKATPLPDQPARDAIVQHLTVNMVVEASAGSGKTESLAKRMAAGIAAGTYTVDHMAAVTFTRKAAAELRGRFQLELEQQVRTRTGNSAARARVEQALSRLEQLFAGTFHAFCAQLIQERPVEAGVAPGFTQLEEHEDLRLRRRLWRQFVEHAHTAGSHDYQEVLEAGLSMADLEDTFTRLCTFADVAFPPGQADRPDPVPTRRRFEAWWAQLAAFVPADIPQGTDCKLLALIRTTRRTLDVGDLHQAQDLAACLRPWETPPVMTQKHWPGTPAERKARKARLDGLIEDCRTTTVAPFLTAWREYLYRIALALLGRGRDSVTRERRRMLALNYEDLLQIVAALLREREDVRRSLQHRYRWLFVDEFQDTDPIQAEILMWLASDSGGRGPWSTLPLRPGALFIVGDPKQSIYRFRRADIDTYQRVRRQVQDAGGLIVSLTTSFRSTRPLCEWTNQVFQASFPRTATAEQPAFEGVYAENPAPGSAPPVVTLTVPEAVSETGIPAAEAAIIAAYIRAEVDAGRRQPGDFLVLTRKRRALDRYAAALEARHLPVEVSGASAVSASPSVEALLLLLRLLADPDDGPAAIGVLRGPLFGISDEALFEHRRRGGTFLLTVPEPTNGPVAEALEHLQTMYRWTRTNPAGAAVERILEHTGLLALAMCRTPGGADAAALLQIVEAIRVSSERGESLAQAVLLAEEIVADGSMETVPLDPGQGNVVRVMNVHKAKGLEAPVVLLADPLGGVAPTVDVRITRTDLEATGSVKLTRPKGDWGRELIGHPAGWDTHEQAELAYVTAEEDRLLYVACTRARELLVVSRWKKDGGRGTRPWAKLDSFLADAPGLSVVMSPSATDRPPAPIAVSADVEAQAAREARHRRIVAPTYGAVTVTGLSTHGGSRSAVPAAEIGPDAGAAWGTLIHRLFEYALWRPEADRERLRQQASWHTREHAELTSLVDQAVATVETLRGSAFWQEVLAAEERHAEVPFCVPVTEENTPLLVTTGVMDLVYRTSQGWHVVDYKTDHLSIAELGVRYGDQLKQYAKHWATLAGKPVWYAGIYAVRQGSLSPNLL